MQEMEVFMSDEGVQHLIKAKALVPTAQVTKYKHKIGGETGFDDFVDDLTFSDNDNMEYKFDSKQAERFRDGSI